MLDSTTMRLNEHYPIECGLGRKKVYNAKELVRYVEDNNGITDCYTSIASFRGSKVLVSKLYLDLDSPKGVEGSIKEARNLLKYFMSTELFYIPVVSGRKGFNFYVPTRPKIYSITEAKEKLRNAYMFILDSCFGHNDDGIIQAKCIDPVIVNTGDIRRVSRVPNTLRPPENKTWCSYLPKDFSSMSIGDITLWMKEPHYIEYDIPGSHMLPKLEDFPEAPEELKVVKPGSKSKNTKHLNDYDDSKKTSHKVLKELLRPCIYQHITVRNPLHIARVAATATLAQFYEPEQILQFYASLKWLDYEKEKTMYWILNCSSLHWFSCKRLKEIGLCTDCGGNFE